MAGIRYSGVAYLGGIPSFPKPATCSLIIAEGGIILRGFFTRKAFIPIQSVQHLEVVPYLQLYPPAMANKSAVGRAVAGGLLLGPLGAVVGGMSGIGQKQNLSFGQKRHKDDFVLLLEGVEEELRFRCGFIFKGLLLKKRAAHKPLEQIQQMRLRFALAPRQTNSATSSSLIAEIMTATPMPVRGN